MVIRLGGSWQIDDGLPPAAQVERELGAGTVRRVARALDVKMLELAALAEQIELD